MINNQITTRGIKIGDRVRIKTWDNMVKEFGTDVYGNIRCLGTFTKAMQYLCGKVAVVKNTSQYTGRLTLQFESRTIITRVSSIYSSMVELVDIEDKVTEKSDKPEKPVNEVIVITHNNHSTMATYFKNNEMVSQKAMCSPDNTFDFGYGALLAVERLFPESKKIKDNRNQLDELLADQVLDELDEADIKLPKKFLTKNNTYCCEVGKVTGIIDVFKETLRTGDVVEVYDKLTGNTLKAPVIEYRQGYCIGVNGFSDCNFVNGSIEDLVFIIRVTPFEHVKNGDIVGDYAYVIN